MSGEGERLDHEFAQEHAEWRAALNRIGSLITRDFGEPCFDYDEDCACCQAWRWYDNLDTLAGIFAPPTEARE